MLPRYLIADAAANANDPDGGPVFVADTQHPPLLVRLDADVHEPDAARYLATGSFGAGAERLQLRVWSPEADAEQRPETMARLTAIVRLYRDQVEFRGETTPAEWGFLFHPTLEPLTKDIPAGAAGLPALVGDSALGQPKWSGVLLLGLQSIHLWTAADGNAKAPDFTPEATWPMQILTAEDEAFGHQAAVAAWAEHASRQAEPPEPSGKR